jgi:2,4-dienoyl-CoA reductase (NADPH2)
MLGGATYEEITPEGIRLRINGEPLFVPADTIVLCAGQDSERGLAQALMARGRPVHVIGGADVAAELDAKRAIDQGTRLAARL